MAVFDHPDFARLACGVLGEVVPSSSRSFDLVLPNDTAVRVVCRPEQGRVVAIVFAADAAALVGPARAAVVRSLLGLNDAGLGGRPLVCGLDSRNFVTVRSHVALDGLDEDGLADFIDYVARQGERVRSLVRALSFQEAVMDFEFKSVAGEGEG